MNDGSYQPLSRPLFIYVRDTAAQRAEVKEFIQFYLSEGAELVKEVGYVPLPPQAYKLALQHFNDSKLGTVFGGVPEVGVTIDSAAGARRQALIAQCQEPPAASGSARLPLLAGGR